MDEFLIEAAKAAQSKQQIIWYDNNRKPENMCADRSFRGTKQIA